MEMLGPGGVSQSGSFECIGFEAFPLHYFNMDGCRSDLAVFALIAVFRGGCLKVESHKEEYEERKLHGSPVTPLRQRTHYILAI